MTRNKKGTGLLLLLMTLFGIGCRPDAGNRSPVPSGSLPVMSTLSPFALTTERGDAMGSDDLQGKVWVATVILTRSQANTPQQMSLMRELQRGLLSQPALQNVRLVTLTAEPEQDTPSVLEAFAVQSEADSTNWHFLTGSRPTVAGVVDALGLPVREEGPITLSPKFALVDRQLRVRGLYDVFTSDQVSALLQDIQLILPEAPQFDDGSGRTNLVVPPENLDLDWLETRGEAQRATVEQFDVFHDFTFDDQRVSSGITFRNKIVDNAGKHWMPNHYDHGNGVALADVDGDGRLDLYFTSQVGGNALFRNLGGGRFEDVTSRAGVALKGRTNITSSFADIDNDGDEDLYVTCVKCGNVLLQNDGSGVFKDISSGSGVDYSGHSSSPVFFDYDRDGLLDLFLVNVGVYTSDRFIPVTNGSTPEQSDGQSKFYEGRDDAFAAHLQPDRAERSILYRNLGGGRFEDVTERVGLLDEGWSGDATPIDANADGWTDLYVLNMQGDDQYYENVRGERFVRKSRELFPRTPWGSMGVKSFDYDNDGRMDLYLTDMHSDMSRLEDVAHEKHKADMQWPDSLLATDGRSIFGNAFYRAGGRNRFTEVSEAIGAENYWPWGPSVGDLNADGFDDIFVASSMNFPFTYGVNTVLLNNRGKKFLDSEYILGVEPRKGGKTLTPWFTLDCDEADKDHDYCNGRTGDVLVWAAVGSRSAAIFDLDDDGDLDIVTNDFNSEPLVLVSSLSESKPDFHFLKVKLTGTRSNRDALGARVTVRAGGREYLKVLDGQTGYLSHGVYPLYFGLDEAATVDEVKVQWPSGTTQTVAGPIAAGKVLEVTEE